MARVVYRYKPTGQRFIPLALQPQTLDVYDVGGHAKRRINRLLWELDLKYGSLVPESARRGWAAWRQFAAAEEAMMAKVKKGTTADLKKAKVLKVTVLKKAKPAVAVGHKPVRAGSIKHGYFMALMKGGTVDAVMARLKGKVKGKVTPAKVQKFGGWAVKRGLVAATKANGVTRFAPGTAKLELRGKK